MTDFFGKRSAHGKKPHHILNPLKSGEKYFTEVNRDIALKYMTEKEMDECN